jgi:uncharacterized protein CbrC (UPF0167 family)
VDDRAFPAGTPERAVEEIANRTPGYSSWQPERWPVCCSDAAAFAEPIGIEAIRERRLEREALTAIAQDFELDSGEAKALLATLDRDHGPTAYLFQCRHCKKSLITVDCP